MKRLLITGGTGLLGLNWACGARHRFDVILGTHRHTVSLQGTQSCELDLESVASFTVQLRRLAPDAVVHTVGMTNVDQCEQHPAMAEHVNAQLATNVAIATRALAIKLIHVSTDHLFSGKQALVREEDQPVPLNAYARTKLQAEVKVREANPQALIVRTNFFGWGSAQRRSFSDWILDSLRAGRQITAFDNVFFTPILADALASASCELLIGGASGTYNVVGDQRVSKFDFAQRLAVRFGLPTRLISRGQIDESGLSAPRPRDMSLDNSKARVFLNRNIGSLDEFLHELFDQEQQGRTLELRNAVTEK